MTVSVERDDGIMREGLSVLLDVNGEKQSFGTIRSNQRTKVGKAFCSLGPLIGAPYGSVFEVQTSPSGAPQLVRIMPSAQEEQGDEGDEGIEEDLPAAAATAAAATTTTEAAAAASGTVEPAPGSSAEDGGLLQLQQQLPSGKDNRALVDNNQAQTLSMADILQMKKKGMAGDDIVKALVANSASFSTKTEFSQEKYLRKKQKKHAPRLVARRPSARIICEAYFLKTPYKTGFMRVDALALLLAAANVGSYGNVLVIDGCGGLPTAAVAERLGGYGSVCSAWWGPRAATIDIIRLLNLSTASAACITRAPLSQLISTRSAALAPPAVPAPAASVPAGAASGGREAQMEEAAAPVAVPSEENPAAAAAAAVEPEVGSGDAMEVDAADVGGAGEPASASGGAGAGAAAAAAAGPAVGGRGAGDAGEQGRKGGREPGNGHVETGEHPAGSAAPGAAPAAGAVFTEVGAGTEGAARGEAEGPSAGAAAAAAAAAPGGAPQEGGEEGALQEAEGPSAGGDRRARNGPGARGRGQGHGGGGGGGGGAEDKKAGRAASLEDCQHWARHGFTSLVVAAPGLNTQALLTAVLPLLAPSAPFAIFHNYAQPLAEAMMALQKSRAAVALQLSEPWLRHHQVLPGRTHPHMSMSATGGYILQGIAVAPSAEPQKDKWRAPDGQQAHHSNPRRGGHKRGRPS